MSCPGDNYIVPGANPCDGGGGGGGGTVTAVTGTNAAVATQTSPGVYNIDVVIPPTPLPNLPRIVSGLPNVTFNFTGNTGTPPNLLTIIALSTEFLTGTWLITATMSFDTPGGAPYNTSVNTLYKFGGGYEGLNANEITGLPNPSNTERQSLTITFCENFGISPGSRVQARCDLYNLANYNGSLNMFCYYVGVRVSD